MIPTTQTSFKQIGPIWAQEHIGKPVCCELKFQIVFKNHGHYVLLTKKENSDCYNAKLKSQHL